MKSSKKILVVGIRWPSTTFLMRLLEGLANLGYEITLAHKDAPRCENRMFQPRWIHPFALKFLPLKKWDVIYFPWNSAAIENLWMFNQGAPCVVSCRGSQINTAPHNPERSSIVKGLAETFEKAAAVHCVSEAIKEEAIQYGLAPHKARVICPAVDSSIFIPALKKKQNEIFTVVSAGNLVWQKGYEYALTAIKVAADKGVKVKFQIIGAGSEEQRILYTIQDLNIKGQAELCGQLTPAQVLLKLQSADVYLVSSVSEGISNAALEAMSCGVPVVTTDCGGMREAVTDNVEGFVVPKRDPEAMAAAIISLAKDSDLRKKMGAAGRNRVLKEFSLEHQLKKFDEMFESVIRENNAGK